MRWISRAKLLIRPIVLLAAFSTALGFIYCLDYGAFPTAGFWAMLPVLPGFCSGTVVELGCRDARVDAVLSPRHYGALVCATVTFAYYFVFFFPLIVRDMRVFKDWRTPQVVLLFLNVVMLFLFMCVYLVATMPRQN